MYLFCYRMTLRVELLKLGDTPPSPVGTRRKLSNKRPSGDTLQVSPPDVAAPPDVILISDVAGPEPRMLDPPVFCPLLL